MGVQVEEKLFGVIEQAMSSDAIISGSILQVYFVGIRGTEEINQLASDKLPATAASSGTLPIGMLIGVGAAAAVVVALISFIIKRKYGKGKTKQVENSSSVHEDIEIEDLEIMQDGAEFPSSNATEVYQQPICIPFDPSIASGETELVSNRTRKPCARVHDVPLVLVEESLSEDAEEDALQCIYPRY